MSTRLTVATQSLMLLNGEFTVEQAGHMADRVLREQASVPVVAGEPSVMEFEGDGLGRASTSGVMGLGFSMKKRLKWMGFRL